MNAPKLPPAFNRTGYTFSGLRLVFTETDAPEDE